MDVNLSKSSTFEYDQKKVDKVNTVIIIVLAVVIILQAILKGGGRAPLVAAAAIPVIALTIFIYFSKINRFLKSLLFGVIPLTAVSGIITASKFSSDRFIIFGITIALIALYFNEKLLKVFSIIIDIYLIALYILTPENLLGAEHTVPFLLSTVFMFNGLIIALIFLTKWGNALINDIIGNKAVMKELIERVNAAAEQVAAGTKDVSNSNQEILHGAMEQAASIEELSASVSKITEQTKLNAISANNAKTLAYEARSAAFQGNERMNEMQRAMDDINKSATDISKIIKVIDSIAFQTNILALNAAVEAARAGQYGKGFSVVAEEVRNLAKRSADAAKETTALIELSGKKTKAGTKIVDDTAVALREIVKSIENAVLHVGEIADSSSEQAMAIDEINKGIEQLAQVVQLNSATSENVASASEELSGQAQILQEMVTQFKE
jgi:methyl-accepting chemotaxis protein